MVRKRYIADAKTLLVALIEHQQADYDTLPAVDNIYRACVPDVDLHWLCEAGFANIARFASSLCAKCMKCVGGDGVKIRCSPGHFGGK